MIKMFEFNEGNAAYFSKDELPEFDSCGRRTSCYFYKNNSGSVSCRALVDFYNADDAENQCGKCPFYKTEEEYQSGWTGGFDDEEDEFEEAI